MALFRFAALIGVLTLLVAGLGALVTSDVAVALAKPACNDGIDNDGDGLIDYPADPGCSSKNDKDETDPVPPPPPPPPPPPSSEWTFCANEWERCVFAGTMEVRYGKDTTWTTPRQFTDGVDCNNNVFGDPLPGTSKECQTRAISESPPPSSFPASYFAGPLGSRNILPPKASGAFLGIWDTGMAQVFERQGFVGRTFDILGGFYNAAAGVCWNFTPYADGKPLAQVNNGSIPIITWSPGFTLAEINAGQADACFRDYAQRAKAFGYPHMLRPFHEFNGTWFRYSGCGQAPIDAWRRMVGIFQAEGVTNVAFVWSPAEGYRDCAFESYPGDAYVDWVATAGYNHNKSTAWCGFHADWCPFRDIFHWKPSVSLHDVFGPRKPIMFTETGSKEGAVGQKGDWLRNAGTYMRDSLPYGKALVYFDVDLTVSDNVNWRVDTSQSSYEGFRDLAQMPYFNTRTP